MTSIDGERKKFVIVAYRSVEKLLGRAALASASDLETLLKEYPLIMEEVPVVATKEWLENRSFTYLTREGKLKSSRTDPADKKAFNYLFVIEDKKTNGRINGREKDMRPQD